jgi:hypothetical protein
MNLALGVRDPATGDSAPSTLWKSRCHEGKIGVSSDHDDFPTMLAEVLDVLASHNFHVPGTAEQMGCTASQLLKLVKKEPRAFLWLNEERRKRHLPLLD